MPFFIPALIAGASAIAGMLNNRKKTSQQSSQFNSTDKFSSHPTYTPEQQNFLNQLFQGYGEELNTDPDLKGYEASGISEINRGRDVRMKAIGNILASRGLSFSPVAGAALTGANNAGVSENIQFRNSIPLLARQMRMNTLGQAGGFFSSLPTGQEGTSTRTGDTTGNVTQPGNMLGGAFSGAADTLSYLYGKGAFAKKP